MLAGDVMADKVTAVRGVGSGGGGTEMASEAELELDAVEAEIAVIAAEVSLGKFGRAGELPALKAKVRELRGKQESEQPERHEAQQQEGEQ